MIVMFSRSFGVACVLLIACGKTHETSVDGGDGTDTPIVVDTNTGPDADLCTGGTLCGSPATCCPAGNECFLDACVPACASGTHCGATGATCCASGDVCLSEACVAPGRACADSYDCDPGQFCEPTLMQCLPQPDPLTCRSHPTFDTLQTKIEWSNTVDQIISIPVIANLDGVGAPEMVVNVTHQGGGSFPNGAIEILDGASGAVILPPIAHNPPTSYGSHGRSTIAVGDVDGDLLPDIIYTSRVDANSKSLIVAVDHTGKLLWTSHDANGTPHLFQVENGAISLANFDADPMAEVVVGATLIDNDGVVKWDEGGAGGFVGTNSGYNGGIAAIADLDGDGKPEIVTGNKAWKVGDLALANPVTNYWTYAGTDGYPAIADLDGDGKPEVILVSSSKVHVIQGMPSTGTTAVAFCAQATCATPADRVQPFAIPGTNTTQNRGGPPTVADFDGDGRPEIGVAGGFSYSIYDLDRPGETQLVGTPAAGQMFVRWTKATHDLSSNATGSSVFDFQGDGSAEVIYQDECNVFVYSGLDGSTKLQIPNTTGTIHEYPLVVDVDGDGNSEFVYVANSEGAGSNCPGQVANKGVYVVGDLDDKWVPTRKVWTQHSYHVTNATSAGNVPMIEDNNWTTPGLNDYRKNAQGEGVFNQPNLRVELSIGLSKCDSGMLTLRARVTNVGALGVYPGVVVEFRKTDATGALLGNGTVNQPLLPGQSAIVGLDVMSGDGPDFWAGVDGAPTAGTVEECDETDNQDTITGAACPVIF